jgi:hypothetical protein
MCQQEHPINKFFGGCQKYELLLNRCLREEFEEKRKKNLENARRFQEKWDKFKQESAQQKQPSPSDIDKSHNNKQ